MQKLAYVSGVRPHYTLNLREPQTAAQLTAVAEFFSLEGMHFTSFRHAQALATAINKTCERKR
jgi:hypothetical protein